MTVIETPVGPGTFVSRWREEGPVESDVLLSWKEDMKWPSWLTLAEAALFMDAPELLDAMDRGCHERSLLDPLRHPVAQTSWRI